MLDTLRANSRSVLTYVLFGIIIVVFVVSFGPGSKGCSGDTTSAQAGWAAKVNGEAVSPSEFDQQYGQLLRMYQQQGASDLNPFLQTQLRRMAMDQLVQRELIDQEAQRHGIVVTDDEVAAAVKAIPGFQSGGRFDIDLYRRAVTNAYGSPAKFEERLRKDLAYQKMVVLLRGTAKVSEDEVKDAWAAENDRLSFELARFPYALARAEVKVTDAQVKDFLAREGAKVDEYYKAHPARFDRPRRMRARHILVSVAENAPPEAQEQAKKKIDALAARVKKGEDFAKVASEASDDAGSKAAGGDVGFFGPGVMAKPFEDAASKLSPGQVSEPVRTQFGWHLVKLESVEPAKKESLEEARPQIARELLETELAKKLADARAQETLKQIQAGKSFGEVLPPGSAKPKTAPVKLGGQPIVSEDTGLFPASSAPNVPKLGPAPELIADAVKASAGQVLPRVYDTAGGPALARVKERQRPDLAKFVESRPGVETRLRMRRESELERAWVEALRKAAKVQTNEAFLAGTARAGQVDLD